LDLQKILSELKEERDRIDRAIKALDGGKSSSAATMTRTSSAPSSARPSGGITPEGRMRLSLAMKKRWADRRKKRS